MSDPLEEGVARIKAMDLGLDEGQIKEALRNCNNSLEEAMQLLMPDSPQDADLLGTYNLIPTQTSTSSYEGDVDMRDTETHPGSGGESDRDSTTVSYSLDDDRNIDVEEEVGPPSLQFQDSHEEGGELSGYPTRPDGPPPRYEDIITTNQGDTVSPVPPEDLAQEVQATTVAEDQGQVMLSCIEFPLTHFYELESRVHTDQWSIPYKRDESLAICMMATTKMIRESKCMDTAVCESRRGMCINGMQHRPTSCSCVCVCLWHRLFMFLTAS